MEELDLLVAAARAGGGWAFGRLWEMLAPAVAGYLRGRGVRDADDVTSEVFLAAFRGIGRFEGDGTAFRAWLFTIAHHKRVDLLRRPTRELPLDYPDLADYGTGEQGGGSVGSAEDEALSRLGDEAALRLLDALTEEQRSVLLLRVVADLSLAEVAVVLDKPVGAVKALQHRALGRLRRELDRRGGVSPDGSSAMERSR